MYTANLTAHLTLDQKNVDIASLEDLLTQNEYSWGLGKDRNLETMMHSHENKDYRKIAEKAEKIGVLDEAMERLKMGGFAFIDDNSVLEVYLQGYCEAAIVKTGKFANHWALGLQMNSPYEAFINNMLLQYREEGWLTDTFNDWYSGDTQTSCSSSLGSETTFGPLVLSGLYVILLGGIVLSFITVLIELLYVAHQHSVRTGCCLVSSLRFTFRSTCLNIRDCWCSVRILPDSCHDNYHVSCKCSRPQSVPHMHPNSSFKVESNEIPCDNGI